MGASLTWCISKTMKKLNKFTDLCHKDAALIGLYFILFINFLHRHLHVFLLLSSAIMTKHHHRHHHQKDQQK